MIKGFFSRINKYVMIVIILFLVTAIAFVIGYKKFNANKSIEINATEEKVQADMSTKSNEEDYIDEYSFVHDMTNSVIIADIVWSKKEISNENISKMKKAFGNFDKVVVEHLEKWEKLDFSESVKFHNYVWNKLGGTIGKATALNKEKIEEVVNNLKS